MYLPIKEDFLNRSDFTLSTPSALPAQTVKVTLDRTFPIDAIYVVVTATTTAAAVGTAGNPDGLLGLLKRAILTMSQGEKSNNVVDASGPALVEEAAQLLGNVDRETMAAVATVNNVAPSVSTTYQITYPILLAHPQLVDPLRMLTLLPVHLSDNDPVLELQFAPQSEISSTIAFSAVTFDVIVRRRKMPKVVSDNIRANGGFLSYDVLETSTSFAATNSDARVDINSPGAYTGLLIRSINGVNTRGNIFSPDVARLEAGGTSERRFRLAHAQVLNDLSRVANSKTATNFVGSYFQDFLTDGTGTDANELGSLLDCNLLPSQGLKMQLIGSITGGTYNKVNILGRRFYGDLNKFRAIKF